VKLLARVVSWWRRGADPLARAEADLVRENVRMRRARSASQALSTRIWGA
jgi:hypothetical protein